MNNFTAAVELLNKGQHITRKGMNFKKSSFFLKASNGKTYLFMRSIRPHSGEVIESPATFDWNDMMATNWKIIN